MLELLDAALPTHPSTGLAAIGFLRNGEPVWPVIGGAEEEESDDETGAGETETEEEEDKPLGPAGQKALDAMKVETKRLKTELAEARASNGDPRGLERVKAKAQEKLREQLAELQAKLDGREAEYAEQKRDREVELAALGKANERILKSELKAAATGKLANPALALKLLDLSQFEVDDDGNVDEKKVNDAIAALIKKEPYLAAQGRRFQGDADAGPRGHVEGTKPAQVTEEQLKSMSPNEIVKAQQEGRLEDLLGGKR